jgi:hypothetical protein
MRDLHIRIKEMHIHMRETKLKEEEELKNMKKLSKSGRKIKDMWGIIGEVRKETCYIILLHIVGSMLCVVIPISMYCNSNLFYVSYFKFLCNYFLKFIIHKMNSKIVKSGIVIDWEKNADMPDADVTVSWML